MPTTAATVACQATAAAELSAGEAERFQQRQVPSAAAHRRDEGQAEGDDRPGGEPDGEDDRRRADAAVVDDLGRTLHAEDGDVVVAAALGSAAKTLSAASAMRCMSASPAAALTPPRSRTKTSSGR